MCRDESNQSINQSINQSTDLLICSTVRCVRYSLCLFPVISYDTTLLVGTDCSKEPDGFNFYVLYFLLTPSPLLYLACAGTVHLFLSVTLRVFLTGKASKYDRINYSTVQYNTVVVPFDLQLIVFMCLCRCRLSGGSVSVYYY